MVPTGRVAHSRGAGCCWRPAADPRLRRGVGSGPRSNAEAERCRRHSAAYPHLSSAAAPTALLAPPVGRVNNAHAELESLLQTGLQPFPVTRFGGKRERLPGQHCTVYRPTMGPEVTCLPGPCPESRRVRNWAHGESHSCLKCRCFWVRPSLLQEKPKSSVNAEN